MIRVDHLDHLALTVRDLQRSVEWYRSVLGLERRYEHWQIPVMLCAGNTCLALFPAEADAPDIPYGGLRHFAFRVGRDMFGQAQDELRRKGTEYTFEDHGISHSLYLCDPDGYRVELTTYEV